MLKNQQNMYKERYSLKSKYDMLNLFFDTTIRLGLIFEIVYVSDFVSKFKIFGEDQINKEVSTLISLILMLTVPITILYLVGKNKEKGVDLNKLWSDKIIKNYDEETLLLISSSVILLFIYNLEFRELIFGFSNMSMEAFFVSLTLFIGIVLTIYNAFSRNNIGKLQKKIMLFFVIFVNYLAGVIASFYIIDKDWFGETTIFIIIFPLINIYNAINLSFLFLSGAIDINSILNKNMEKYKIVPSFIVIGIIFIISQFVLKNYWALTFSLCILYATIVNKYIEKIFFRKTI